MIAKALGLYLLPITGPISILVQVAQALTENPTETDHALRSAGDFDELVERWHNGAGNGMPLHTFLGMTWEQYAEWVMN